MDKHDFTIAFIRNLSKVSEHEGYFCRKWEKIVFWVIQVNQANTKGLELMDQIRIKINHKICFPKKAGA